MAHSLLVSRDLLREDGNEGLVVRENPINFLVVNSKPQIHILVFVLATQCTDDLAFYFGQLFLLLGWNVVKCLLIITRIKLVLLKLVGGGAGPGLIQDGIGIGFSPAV